VPWLQLPSVEVFLLHYDAEVIGVGTLGRGEFNVSEFDSEERVRTEIERISPSEIIVPASLSVNHEFMKSLNYCVHTYGDEHFQQDRAHQTLMDHFSVVTLNGFGVQGKTLGIRAAGGLVSYLYYTQKQHLPHIASLHFNQSSEHMVLDASTKRNLELLSTMREGDAKGALFYVLNKTLTSMGARLLKKWLLQPLLDLKQIQKRLDVVSLFKEKALLREDIRDEMQLIHDMERLMARVGAGTASPRDCVALKESLERMPYLKEKISKEKNLEIYSNLPILDELCDLIQRAIAQDPPALLRDGNVIKNGYNEDLDKLREIMKKGRTWIADLEAKEKEKTQIKNLRVGFNNVFGYYFAISKSQISKVPDYYIRKQTTVNEERFVTQELKEEEQSILSAEEKGIALEQSLYNDLLEKIRESTSDIQKISKIVAEIDVQSSLGMVASTQNYCKPIFVPQQSLKLEDARHPVIETLVDQYIPNSINLSSNSTLHIITGPNMSGKSTIMRQVALIQLMAQMGSFVPSRFAELSICDRIFTRVGAHDDLAQGQSTFMVEMTEAAHILNHATEKSLVILDEIGRGTSTYDGISLAWAIAEYLHKVGSFTLFATHYHQMNKLAESCQNAKNFNISVHDEDDEIVFLHKLVEGGTDKSYGIHVAKIAGVPNSVIERSRQIMGRLEMEDTIAERVHGTLPRKDEVKNKGEVRKEVKGTQMRLDEV